MVKGIKLTSRRQNIFTLYNKGMQVGSQDNISAYRSASKSYIGKKGAIKTLADLKDKNKPFKLTQLIDDCLNNLQIIDSMNVNVTQNDSGSNNV